jgi:hypothetical protein
MAEKNVSNMKMLFARVLTTIVGHRPNSDRISSGLRLMGIRVACNKEEYGMRIASQPMGRQRVREKEIRRREIEPREREDVPARINSLVRPGNPSFYACLTSVYACLISVVLASEGLEGRGDAGVVRAKL